MNKYLFFVEALAAVPALGQTNIILINLDDAGYGDFSYNGAYGYTTPHIDRLAAEGMRFTHFLACQPISGASRAGLMTGCYPNRIGFAGAPGTAPLRWQCGLRWNKGKAQTQVDDI